MSDRLFQNDCNKAIIEGYDQGWHQQIVAMATGTGKTWVFSELYEAIKPKLPGQMLVLAHTEFLVDQNIATMRAINPSLKVDKEMAEHRADPSTADVICASVPTLGRKNTSRLTSYVIERFDKIIVDEAHHTPADSYMNVLKAFRVLEDGTDKLLVGFTATPTRTDGKALGEIYKKNIFTYSMRQAIEDGYLTPIKGYRVFTKTDISNVSTTHGDLNKVELEQAIDSPERNKLVVDAWRTKAEGRKTIVYAAGVQHAQNLADAFYEAGYAAKAVWGDDPLRDEKVRWHKNTAGSVLVNAQLLIEGYDDPSISCVVIASPTASSIKFTQMCGRCTRLFASKVDSLILDITDSCGQHSLMTLPMLMGMPANLDLQGYGLLNALQMIEAKQEEFPNIDFSKLKTMTGLQHFIEQVNLFEVRFPPEVEGASDFRWTKAVTGGYVLRVPKLSCDTTGDAPGIVRIEQDLLDKWQISGIIRNRAFQGFRNSIEEAFAVADQQIRERAPESVVLVNRQALWMNKPATKGQLTLLGRLYGKREWPDDLNQGQASHWIDQRIGGKK
jgi:superfamily II DNA or RNA helicase